MKEIFGEDWRYKIYLLGAYYTVTDYKHINDYDSVILCSHRKIYELQMNCNVKPENDNHTYSLREFEGVQAGQKLNFGLYYNFFKEPISLLKTENGFIYYGTKYENFGIRITQKNGIPHMYHNIEKSGLTNFKFEHTKHMHPKKSSIEDFFNKIKSMADEF